MRVRKLLINAEVYKRYLEKQQVDEHNSRLLRQYIFENYRDMVLEPEHELWKENVTNAEEE